MTSIITAPASLTEAQQLLQTTELRIRAFASAKRLWARCLTSSDRRRLGDDLEPAYCRHGTGGMWARLRGISPIRAVVGVARILGFLSIEDHDWILHEAGEILGVDEALAHAIDCGDLVLAEQPQRDAFWSGTQIEIDWVRYDSAWVFLLLLSRHAKSNQSVDRTAFGRNPHRDCVAKRKHRLTRMSGFPADLRNLIIRAGLGTQRLNFPAHRIRIFETSATGSLVEWNP